MAKTTTIPIQSKFDFQALPDGCEIIVGDALTVLKDLLSVLINFY